MSKIKIEDVLKEYGHILEKVNKKKFTEFIEKFPFKTFSVKHPDYENLFVILSKVLIDGYQVIACVLDKGSNYEKFFTFKNDRYLEVMGGQNIDEVYNCASEMIDEISRINKNSGLKFNITGVFHHKPVEGNSTHHIVVCNKGTEIIEPYSKPPYYGI